MNRLCNSLGRAIICVTMVTTLNAIAAIQSSNMPESILKCVALRNDTERLACFDNEVARVDLAAEPAPAAGTTGGSTDITRAEEAPVAATPAAAADPKPDVSARKNSLDSFGLSSWRDKKDEVREITAAVTSIRKRAYGQLVLTLDNGQIWTEKDPVRGFRVKEGDTLTIRKGNLGGFRMINSSKRSSAAIRME